MWDLNKKIIFAEALANGFDVTRPANDVPQSTKAFKLAAVSRKPVPKPRVFAGAAFNMNGIAY